MATNARPAKAGTRARKTAPTKARKTAPTKSTNGGAARPEKRADEGLVEGTLELLAGHDRAVAGSKREVGRHVLEGYFGGDESLARSRNPKKPVSYQRLVERAPMETSWDARALSEAVRIELCARTLPAAIADAIDASYLLRLSTIDDLETRRAVAARIVREGLRGDAVSDLIAAHSDDERGGGRERTPRALLALARIERALEHVRQTNALAKREVAKLDEEDRRALRTRAIQIREALTELLDGLGGDDRPV